MKEYERVASPKDRLKEAMRLADKKQADLVRETGLNRGTISRYISGEIEPRMGAANKLAVALGVNEMWLGGYDVRKDRSVAKKTNDQLVPLIVRLRTDKELLETVLDLAKLSGEQLAAVKQLLSALRQ